MKFIKVEQILDGVGPLRDRIMRDLEYGKQVMWLVPGGSNIPLSVAVMAQLPDELTRHLTIMLTDERYGDVGHDDSNAHQLDESGFMPRQATVVPVLQAGLDIAETTRQYGISFHEASQAADVIIGQFGMGSDGHIAGILPGSPAITSVDYAAAYNTEQYDRITLTPKALLKLTTAYVFALGNDKLPALEALSKLNTPVAEQPAQLLKQLSEVYVYNDQISN